MTTTYRRRISPVPVGDFSATSAYDRLDIVRYAGRSYICRRGAAPGAWRAADWLEMCADGEKGGTGAPGKDGRDGEKGEPGKTGPGGLQGERGLTGDRGPQGEVGLQGVQGPAGPKGEGRVAFVDVWRVIGDSTPGKAGAAFIDNLVVGFHAEMDEFIKSLNGATDGRIGQKGAELEAREKAARKRVNDRLMEALGKCASEWLEANEEGVTMVLPMANLFVAKWELDVGTELLRRLELVSVNFDE